MQCEQVGTTAKHRRGESRATEADRIHVEACLGLGDAGASKGSAEHVTAFVNCIGADDGKDVVLDEILLEEEEACRE